MQGSGLGRGLVGVVVGGFGKKRGREGGVDEFGGGQGRYERRWSSNLSFCSLAREVGEVLADAEGGFGEGLGLRERGAVPELRPRAALVEAVSEGRGEVVDEGAEGRVVRRSLDGAAACGGGLGVGYGKDGSRGGGHDSFSERQSREGHSERQLQHYYFSCFGFW